MSYFLSILNALKLGLYTTATTLALIIHSALGLANINIAPHSGSTMPSDTQNTSSETLQDIYATSSTSLSVETRAKLLEPTMTGYTSPDSKRHFTDTTLTLPAQTTSSKTETRETMNISGTMPTYAPTNLHIETLNTQIRSAMVNIYCTSKTGGYLHPISGSGVMVDTRGVILTNAHVAQYFLLQDFPTQGSIECTIRTGAPAKNAYTAKLLYFPTIWLEKNASQILAETPLGTGEHDYAFLLITGTTNLSETLPSSFTALPMSSNEPDVNEQVLIAGYPAGFLGGQSILSSLYPTSAISSIKKLYSFNGTNVVEAFSLGGSVVAQAGSSGGAVVDIKTGRLIGIISTEVSAESTADRDLRATSMKHINQSLSTTEVGSISDLLSQDVVKQAHYFTTRVSSTLTQILANVLKKTQ